MDKKYIIEALKVQPLTEEEKTSRHILGRLYGPIATSKESTRNGRKYNRELWENALNDPLMGEKIKNKSLFLELGHPLDGREETIMANACACIPEMPKIVDGDLIAYIDILDTPNGRILKTLCDYGFVPGISSRGTGDVIGDEVDPNTFNLETWDIVQLPAVESARLSPVNESLDPNIVKLRTALTESLKSASEEDKKIMEESLHNLGINTDETNSGNTLAINPTEESSVVKAETSAEAIDNGLESAIKSLQEAVTDKARLEAEIKSLQEKLAVSDTKVKKLNEELGRYKSATIRLSSIASENKNLASQVTKLTEDLESSRTIIKEKDTEIQALNESKESSKTLQESVSSKDAKINSLTEDLKTQKETYESQINQLNEDLKTSASKNEELNTSLTEAIKERDGWKRTAVSTVNSYIKSKALMLGVEEEQIRNRLPESYNLKDIDRVCDNLTEYAINRSRLPFNVDGKIKKVTITESNNNPLRQQVVNDDDEVSPGLLKMSGLNN